MEQIKERLEVILEKFEVEKSSVNLDANFVVDLNMDSLDVLEFVLLVEEEFGVKISALHIPEIKTIGDTIEYIESELAPNYSVANS